MKSWPAKDPNEILNYGFDWRPRGLGDDKIISTTAVVQEGTVEVDDHFITDAEGKDTTTYLSGGTDGTKCSILLRAKTQGGLSLDETMTIKIKTR